MHILLKKVSNENRKKLVSSLKSPIIVLPISGFILICLD